MDGNEFASVLMFSFDVATLAQKFASLTLDFEFRTFLLEVLFDCVVLETFKFAEHTLVNVLVASVFGFVRSIGLVLIEQYEFICIGASLDLVDQDKNRAVLYERTWRKGQL